MATQAAVKGNPQPGAAPKVKILRIGIIQGGRIVEERLVRKRENITIGQSAKNLFVAGFQGLTVSQDNELRRNIRATGSKYKVVKNTLVDIGAGNIPTILVLNKIDKLQHEDGPLGLEVLEGNYRSHGFERVVFISATKKENIQSLRQLIFEEVKKKHLAIYPNYVSSGMG